MSKAPVMAGLCLLATIVTTNGAWATILTIDCTYKVGPNSPNFEIEYVDNLDIHNKVTVIGAFGSRTATSYMAGHTLFVLENEADTSASTVMYLDPDVDIVAARSTITTVGQVTNVKPVVVMSQGACRVKR